jgi:hypothetical protein
MGSNPQIFAEPARKAFWCQSRAFSDQPSAFSKTEDGELTAESFLKASWFLQGNFVWRRKSECVTYYIRRMGVRSCRVTIADVEGCSHSVRSSRVGRAAG